jgi:predicted metalloendopeptidase
MLLAVLEGSRHKFLCFQISGTGNKQITFYNPRSINQIQRDYPYVEWLSFLNNILDQESQLQSSDIVIVEDLWYFERLGYLLRRTPKRILANHIAYRQVAASIHFLPEAFRKLLFKIKKPISGAELPKPRWYTCINVVSKYYPQAFGALFIRKFVQTETKAKASEVAYNVKNELKSMMEDNTWMQEDTKQEALSKAEAMSEQVGYSDDLLSDEKIVEYHKTFSVVINETAYFESILKLRVAIVNQNNKKLREPIDKTDLKTQVPPLLVNAYYSVLENTIRITAATINGGFFNVDRPQYMNYGDIGRTIGHEIFHGEQLIYANLSFSCYDEL